MRATIIKVILFLSIFGYFQGVILPWAISNNFMPLWADILLIALILCMWCVLIERVTTKVISRIKDDKNVADKRQAD